MGNSASLLMYLKILSNMGLFKHNKDSENQTKCEKCGTDLHDPERLKRHMKKAHGNVPAKKLDPNAGDGGLW